MPLAEPTPVDDLIHADERVFERGMSSLASRPAEAGEPSIAQFKAIFAALAAANLGPMERERRATLILRHAPTCPEFLEAIGASAAAWTPDIRNAVVRFLPPRYKQLVFGKPLPSSSLRQSSTVPQEAATPAETALPRVDDDEGFPEVLLLGTEKEQDPNRRLLEREKFRPRRAGSFDEFRHLLTADVCGIVVGRSWWSMLERVEHERFVEVLCNYSSLAWLKIDIYGCSQRQLLPDACRNARYREAKISEVTIGETSLLNDDVDLPCLRRAADLIDNSMGIRLCPADIQSAQAQVLIASVANEVHSRHYRGAVHFEEIATTTLQRGQSQALIIRAQPDDGGLPYIAKVAPIGLLRDEMERFQRFILPWDDLLRPQFHFHDSDGAIIFGLVGTAEEPLQPAPTLDDTLRKVLQTESGAPGDGLPTEADVLALIDRTVQKVMSLNTRSCADASMPSLAWIDVETFDAMIACGIQWHLPSLRSGRDPLSLRHEAAGIVAGPLRAVATIHGDMHLRNVLVRDRRDPFLIDYAYSGPGHPCFDLVRFESALLFQLFRMTEDEHGVCDLLKDVFSAATTLDALRARFPSLCASLGNRIALQAAIGARSACMQLLRQHGGGSHDYLAMQLVVACQSLTMQQLQTGIVRAAIVAAAQLLDDGA